MKQLSIFLLTSFFFSLLQAQIKSDRTCNCPDSRPTRPHYAPQPSEPTYHYSPKQYKHKKQKHRSNLLHLQLGGAATYAYGTVGEFQQDFDENLVNGEVSGFLGIRMQPRQRRRSNVFGVWGRGGLNNLPALSSLIELQGIKTTIDPNTEYHEFREWEAGVLFKEWFRVSAGQGTQQYIDLTGQERDLNYYLATTGFSFNILPSVKWNTNVTALFGKDFQEISIRPSTGLSFRFNFL